MKTSTLLLTAVFLLSLAVDCSALTFGTHKTINSYVMNNMTTLDTKLKNYNLPEGIRTKYIAEDPLTKIVKDTTIIDIIANGGITEDTEPVIYSRSFNHFHDPLAADNNWNLAGFNWYVPPVTNLYSIASPFLNNGRYYHTSSAVWAQKPVQDIALGNYSWPAAREHFYNALIANNDDQRNFNFAECFRAVGQLMHLVQDASVPAHTRNDAHVIFMYEDWVESIMNEDKPNNYANFNSNYLFNNYAFTPSTTLTQQASRFASAKAPIANLFDTDTYNGTNPNSTTATNVGLAVAAHTK